MRKRIFIFMLGILLFSFSRMTAFAVGEGNVDGGGGDLGQGSGSNYWTSGDEGVRVTVVKSSDGTPATTPIDITNKNPNDILRHFGKASKLSYRNGSGLSVRAGGYRFINPSRPLPKIIKSAGGGGNITAIKSYFTDEQILRSIAGYVGMDFKTMINGEHKLLIEPIAYATIDGVRTAMTATEAAFYNRLRGGLLRSKMPSLSHKNLPLSLFLEKSDLGYPAWSGGTSGKVSDEDIISALGLGIVKFKEMTEPPLQIAADYEYRVDTDVVTAISISGGQSDPDNPISVVFSIGGQTYGVGNVFYPEGGEQLAWVKWHTPSKPQVMEIQVTVSGGGSPGKGTLTANIVDLSGNDPPNPVADDRNDGYSAAEAVLPNKPEKTSAHWGIWVPRWRENWVWHSNMVYHSGSHSSSCDEDCVSDHGSYVDEGEWVDEGWWEFDYRSYSASLSADMTLITDTQSPTASGETTKSGYGVQTTVTGSVSSSQSASVTNVQTAVSYFPEFYYDTYWRLLERTRSGGHAEFQFNSNPYSTYNRRTHFTPIWMPDGEYRIYTWLIDCWTPDGMLSKNLNDSIHIDSNLWTDWHIAPVK